MRPNRATENTPMTTLKSALRRHDVLKDLRNEYLDMRVLKIIDARSKHCMRSTCLSPRAGFLM